MEKRNKSLKAAGFFITIAATISLMTIACSSFSKPSPQPVALTPTDDGPAPTPKIDAPVTDTDIWSALLQKVPYPYTTPLPAQSPTILDGIYVKLEPKEGTPVPCRRCPDYLPEGGTWKLNLDKGIFRIFHAATGWRSLGSFTVSQDQILLFNDPACFETVGIYEWKLEEGKLSLKTLEDSCQVDRRARSFTNFPWVSCHPPSTEAAVTNHWSKPPGCEGGE